MAYLREGLESYTKEHFFRRLHNPFAVFRPFLFFLGLVSQERMTRLGRPKTTAVFGDLSRLDRTEVRRMGHSNEHFFPYQKKEPDDGDTVDYRGETPQATEFAEDNAGMIACRWTHFEEPVRIGRDALEDASGPSAIMDLSANAAKITFEALLKRVNNQLVNGTLTQTQQDSRRWRQLLGVSHVLTTNNYYGRVDRSVETDLNPLNIAAATDLDSTTISFDTIDVVNDGNSSIEGRAARSADGRGCNLHMVHPALFGTLRQQARGNYQIHVNGIPGHGISGHKKPVIEYGDNWIVYDRNVPTDELWSLKLDSWYLEVHPKYNFTPMRFVPKDETEEGGARYEWSKVRARVRLTCREPWLQSKTTGLIA